MDIGAVIALRTAGAEGIVTTSASAMAGNQTKSPPLL
jgi:hypothetical protein